jgi:hypothetical protein
VNQTTHSTSENGSKRYGREWDNGVKVVTGAIALAIGVFFVYVFIPERIADPGSLRLVAFGLACSLLAGPALWALRDPLVLIHPVSIISLGLIYWILLDLLQALYVPEVWDNAPVYAAFGITSLFAFGVYCGGFLFNPTIPRWLVRASSYSIKSRQLFIIAIFATVLSFLRFAIPSEFDVVLMITSLGSGRWAAPWARGDVGGWDAFLDHMAYFGYVLPSIAVLMYRLDKRLTYRTIWCVLFALLITAFLAQGGGRRIVGATWGAAMIVWILTSRTPVRTMILIGLTGVPLLLVVMQLMLELRNIGVAAIDDYESEERSGFSVDDNFNRMAQTISLVPSEFPHVGVKYVVWVAARPIPRVLWAGKPMGHGFDLPGALGKTGVSLTTSVVGESYLAFSYAGCFVVGALYGALGAVLLSLLRSSRDSPSGYIIYAAGLFALFVGLRSAIELVLFSYVILAWLALVWLLKQFRRT